MLFGLLFLLFFIAVTPVCLRVDGAVKDGFTGAITFSVWGIGKTIQIGSATDERGRVVFQYYLSGSPKRHNREAGDALIGAMGWIQVYMKGNLVRRLAQKTIHVLKIRGVLRISLQDAGKTALISVAAQELVKELSRYLKRRGIDHTIRAWPDFTFKGSAIQGSGILFVRLGNLFLLGAMMAILVRRAKKAKEAAQWNTQLET